MISSKGGARVTGNPHAKNESGNRLHALHKNQLKVDHRPKHKTQKYILLQDNAGENLHDPRYVAI